jgi:hypothetical protein
MAEACKIAALRDGYFTLFNGARRHFNLWAPGGRYLEGAGPCEREEAERRARDPRHPWHGQKLWRAETWKALNTLIQSAAAIQTKLWMRACFRERIVPLLQMHDALDLSVSSPDVAEMVAKLGEEVIKLEVPMKVDIGYGRNWGDATHTWTELRAGTCSLVEPAGEMPGARERAARESPKFPNDSGAAPDPAPAAEPDIEALFAAAAASIAAESGMHGSASFAASPPIPSPPPASGGNGSGKPNGGGYPHSERASGTKVDGFIYRDLKGAPYLRVDK